MLLSGFLIMHFSSNKICSNFFEGLKLVGDEFLPLGTKGLVKMIVLLSAAPFRASQNTREWQCTLMQRLQMLVNLLSSECQV